MFWMKKKAPKLEKQFRLPELLEDPADTVFADAIDVPSYARIVLQEASKGINRIFVPYGLSGSARVLPLARELQRTGYFVTDLKVTEREGVTDVQMAFIKSQMLGLLHLFPEDFFYSIFNRAEEPVDLFLDQSYKLTRSGFMVGGLTFLYKGEEVTVHYDYVGHRQRGEKWAKAVGEERYKWVKAEED